MAIPETRRPAPVTYRWNPFTEAFSAVLISNEDRLIPSSSPFQVRLYEPSRNDSPSTVDCVILVELDEALDASETGVDILAAHYGRVLVNDVLLVDDEQMQVTAKPGSPTLTVTRGYGGTTPDTHTDGTAMEILNSMTEITSGSPATREYRVDYEYSTGLVLFNSAEQGYDVRFDYWGLGTPLYAGTQWLATNMREYGVGDYMHFGKSEDTETVTVLSYTKFKELRLDRAGALRIKFDLYADGGGTTLYGAIYRNGAAVGTQQTRASAGWQTFSEDISGWSTNDLLQLYCYRSAASGTQQCRNFRVFVDEKVGLAQTDGD